MADSQFLFTTLHAKPEPVSITFANGLHTVPEWVVAHLGGKDKLLKEATQFARVTFEEFMGRFNRSVERNYLRNIQSGFVNNALSRHPGRSWERSPQS